MKAAIMIPARYGSSRFPGKPLVMIAGRPLIEWTVRAAMRASLPVFVVTDSHQISEVASMFGTRVILTPAFCQNGTERCAWALNALKGGYDVVLNWQGDAPLIPPDFARSVSAALLTSMQHDVATVATFQHVHQGAVVVRREGGGSTFTRATESEIDARLKMWVHHGMYAYRGDALRRYGETVSVNEKLHGLEQLRWLDHETPIELVQLQPPPYEMREVNYREDVEPVANILRQIHEID